MTIRLALTPPTAIEDEFARQAGRTIGQSMDDIWARLGEPLDLPALNWWAGAIHGKLQEMERQADQDLERVIQGFLDAADELSHATWTLIERAIPAA